MVYASIIGCIIILFFIWQKSKDILAPPFIIGTIWTIMYMALLLRKETVDLSSIYYSSFVIGLLFFTIGFYFIVRNSKRTISSISGQNPGKIRFNSFNMKIIIFIEIALFLFFLVKVTLYISGNFAYNFWQTLSIGKATGMFTEGLIISYSRNAIIALTIVCSIAYFNNPTKKNKNYFLISFIIALFFTVTGGSRGIIFMLLFGVCFSAIIIKKYGNKKILVILFVLLSIVLTTFIAFAYMKYVYEDQSNTFEFVMKQFRIYFTTSMIAFVRWMETFNYYLYGTNTFRFFIEFLNVIGYNFDVSSTVQDFVIVYGDRTNVFTVLHYYAADYGLTYSFVILTLLGLTHGFLYKKAVVSTTLSPFFIALHSIFYFPLIYQFFLIST